MASLFDIVNYCDELLLPQQFKDYCPNGLQVAGRAEVNKIVVGVSACQALLEAAIAEQADLILVHHGYFWQGEDPCVVGLKRARLATLLAHNMSLLAYHLPLDAHPELGNNAQLAKQLLLQPDHSCLQAEPGAASLLWHGQLLQPMSAVAFSEHVATCLQRLPLHIASGPASINSIAWCTGAAQDFIVEAAALDVDAYITGEVSERTTHIAREHGIHFFAAGHHATERYGVQALGNKLLETFTLDYQYIDIDNPV